jgi:acylpyruvate hydrolase
VKLATMQVDGRTRAVRIDDGVTIALDSADLGELFARTDWRVRADAAAGPTGMLDEAALLAPVPRPGKVICVGLNYRNHILEMGRELPEYPTLFAKYADAIVGPRAPIAMPQETVELDWEAELGVVIGAPVRRASELEARDAIAGFTVVNDVTARDWQYRTTQWLQGKTFEATTPLGPIVVTPDELPGGVRPRLTLSCRVDSEEVQRADTADLVFDPVALVQYVSTIMTLRPGDLIASGTPGGVGHARQPPRYLTAGQTLTTEIEGIGSLVNVVQPG